MNALLIGNGVNQITETEFSNDKIASRFRDALSLMEQTLYAVQIPSCGGLTRDDHDTLWDRSKCKTSDSIETLAGKLYETLRSDYQDRNGENCPGFVNTRDRLIETLSVIALSAIFINKGHLKFSNVPAWFNNECTKYDKVFSLNYYEHWDTDSRCVYLHGQLPAIDCTETTKPLAFCSKRLLSIPAYKDHIDVLRAKFDFHELSNMYSLIFMPNISDYGKQTHYGSGLVPSKFLVPSETLCPRGPRDIYAVVEDGINNISLFGISPIGDSDLITRLNGIAEVIIYVYDLSNRLFEREHWENLIPGAVIRDSSEFRTS